MPNNNANRLVGLAFVGLFLLAPLYVWRFAISVGSHVLPTNFLMIASFVVIAFALIVIWQQNLLNKFTLSIKKLPKPLLVSIGLIVLASLISLFLFGATTEKIGQWLVLYAQPMVIFLLLHFFAQREPILHKYFRRGAYALVGAAGALAILQYFTLDTLPLAWWGNSEEPKRAIAFFAHPNAYALFVTPLLAWLVPDIKDHFTKLWEISFGSKSWMQRAGEVIRERLYILAWLVGAFGLLLSLSRGAWLGLLVALAVYALLSANKKVLVTFLVAVVVVAGVVFAVPNLRWRVLLPFHGEKSSAARVSLFHTGSLMVEDSPIFGKGISGFDNNWYAYNTDAGLDHYNFPHNIFLNFWIDLGLLGLLGFMIVIGWSFWQGFVKRNNPHAMALLLFMVALVVHGLIDIPYLKNDLALVFWMILALSNY